MRKRGKENGDPGEAGPPAGGGKRRKELLERELEKVRRVDITAAARRGGFLVRPLHGEGWEVEMPLFGRKGIIRLPEGRFSFPSRVDSFSLRVLALRYITLADGVPVSGRWIAYRDLPGGRFYASTLVPTVERPLADLYGRRRGALGEAARELGGERADFGDESYIFRPFPRTPLLVVLHWGDEEFEPGCRLLFDSCCSHYLNTDDLKVLATQVAAFLFRWAGREEEARNLLWMVE